MEVKTLFLDQLLGEGRKEFSAEEYTSFLKQVVLEVGGFPKEGWEKSEFYDNEAFKSVLEVKNIFGERVELEFYLTRWEVGPPRRVFYRYRLFLGDWEYMWSERSKAVCELGEKLFGEHIPTPWDNMPSQTRN